MRRSPHRPTWHESPVAVEEEFYLELEALIGALAAQHHEEFEVDEAPPAPDGMNLLTPAQEALSLLLCL